MYICKVSVVFYVSGVCGAFTVYTCGVFDRGICIVFACGTCSAHVKLHT